jgi:hypothetical protein
MACQTGRRQAVDLTSGQRLNPIRAAAQATNSNNVARNSCIAARVSIAQNDNQKYRRLTDSGKAGLEGEGADHGLTTKHHQ